MSPAPRPSGTSPDPAEAPGSPGPARASAPTGEPARPASPEPAAASAASAGRPLAAHPASGWDRARFERTADELLLAVRPYASEGRAQIRLPGVPSHNGTWSDGLEGFARTFLLAAFRLAGAGGADPHHLAEWYADGIRAGADPSSPERWPTFAESNQAKVEAASLALALHETRPWIWDRLPERTREQVLAWLGAMVGDAMPGNNWIWFQAVTEAFARTAGGAWSEADLTRTVELTDTWYTGDGWYSDGLTGGAHRNHDHYNGWAMHFYPLWFCRILGDAAPDGLLDRYRARLRRFLDDARHLVGGNGSPLLQGRSLTYRFAALAPVWTGALFDATPLPPGQTRRLAGLMLGHFTGHGATDENGLLTLGWHRPFRPILQVYSGPASPYWASKGFAGLLLPPGHPVWTATEEPLPVERADFDRTLTAPGWLVSGTRADGVVRVANHGGDHADPARPHSDDPLYGRLGYGTHTAPETPGDPRGGPVDSSAVLVDDAGGASHRRPLERLSVAGRTAVSRSRAHWPDDERWDCFGGPDTTYRLGPWITVASVLRGPLEVRIARVDPAPETPEHPAHPGPFRLRLGGWALPRTPQDPAATTHQAPPTATVAGSGLHSTVVSLNGFDHAEVHEGTGSNALGPASATPALRTGGPPRWAHPYAAAVHLSGRPLTQAELPRLHLCANPATGAVEALVSWPDGVEDTVLLPAPAAPGCAPAAPCSAPAGARPAPLTPESTPATSESAPTAGATTPTSDAADAPAAAPTAKESAHDA
ncbi:DUF2264 domain-containing protein [Streptomyces sp. TS71-3]|uniref:DUF2264 domain-containing protein n=1 Tax=Streptomyces sp. TS71-3 TaxID=2733862 RepID=UPI001AFD3663|nr:DUF2264 domain-containing protein [Streptomyces sp. TS71-3]GHJ41083.1 hypothetical protein Sm713_66920 [Streptomyces sp. TS71-3]